MFCSNCGCELKTGESVCANCGNVINEETVPASRLKSTFGVKRTTGIGMAPFQESDLTPPGVYNPTYEAPTAPVSDLRGPEVTPSAEYRPASTGMGGTAPTTTPTPTPAPAPAPTSTSHDYSSPREYMPAPTTDNTKIIKILVAVALLVAVWLLPLISFQQYGQTLEKSGIKYMGECFKSFELLPDILENFDVVFNYSKAGAVASLVEPFVFLLYAFSSLGVFLGTLSGKKSGGKGAAVLGIIGAVLWLTTRFVIVEETSVNISVTDIIGYGFWLSCVLYITSIVLASKE